MTLNEAIIHCEEVAEENEHDAKEYNRLTKLETYPSRKECESAYKKCCKCAEDHRQLANWLKELKRAKELLEATYELLEKQKNNPYVLNLLAETIFYDEAECDGSCLMEDIENLLEYGI